jgi:glycosyltransferase involved in cell wall biosynthesis
LTIVGCSAPKNTPIPAYVEVSPFIGKEAVEGRRRLREIFGRSHFFVMPTRAEAFGLVFAEACAFGVPCLATKLGGLPSVIVDDVNGRLFPVGTGGAVYADHIAGLMRDPVRYQKLALRAAHEAMTRLSWKISGSKVADLFEAMRPSAPSGGVARAPPREAAEPSPLAS